MLQLFSNIQSRLKRVVLFYATYWRFFFERRMGKNRPEINHTWRQKNILFSSNHQTESWTKKKHSRSLFAYFAVHESLELQLSDAKLAVLLSQAPAGLGKVDLCSPHHAHILGRFSQLQLVCPLQLEVLETSDKKKRRRGLFLNSSVTFFAACDADERLCDTRPDEDVELFALHLHVVLFLVQLILQPRVDLRQFVAAKFLWLGLMK